MKISKKLQEVWPQPDDKFSEWTIIVLSLDEVLRLKSLYKKSSQKLVGIKQLHQLTLVNSNKKIIASQLSCFCTSCLGDLKCACSNKGHVTVRQS